MTDRWLDRLSEYIDGEFKDNECAAFEAHLAGCSRCRDELAGLRRTVQRIEEAPDSGPQHDLWPELLAKIEAGEAVAGQSARAHRLWITIAASLALVASLVWVSIWRADSFRQRGIPAATRTADTVDAYRRAAADWHLALEGMRLPAGVDADLRADLAAFDAAVSEATAMLNETPDDAELQAYLLRTLQAQLRFMARLGTWAEEVS